MIGVITVLVTLTLSLLITRVATVALTLTGLSRQSARFQARSALTGVGFTTGESEGVTNHPVRRQIIMWLMLLGNVGIVTVIATLAASLTNAGGQGNLLWNLTLLAIGLVALVALATSRWVDVQLSRAIQAALARWTDLDLTDYTALLQLSHGFAVSEMRVDSSDWVANKSLAKLSLPREGVLVLGIQRQDGTYIGAPTARTQILPGDTLVLYGPEHRHEELNRRTADFSGAQARLEAVSEQQSRASETE